MKLEDDLAEVWIDESEVTARAQAKLRSLKLLVNRAVAHAAAEDAIEVVQPVLRLLVKILTQRDFFIADSDG